MYLSLDESLDEFFGEPTNCCNECDGEYCSECPVLLEQSTENEF